jgi:hypothetical protein
MYLTHPTSPFLTTISLGLKEALGGKTCQSNEEVQEAVHEWLCIPPRDYFFHQESRH